MKVNVSEINVEKVAEDLAVLTSKPETLDDDSLANIASVLTHVVAITAGAKNISEDNVEEVMQPCLQPPSRQNPMYGVFKNYNSIISQINSD